MHTFNGCVLLKHTCATLYIYDIRRIFLMQQDISLHDAHAGSFTLYDPNSIGYIVTEER